MGLVFIPQMIYGYGEPLWRNIDGEKLIRPPELWQSYQQNHLDVSRRNGRKE
jgi:hypothetical protein